MKQIAALYLIIIFLIWNCDPADNRLKIVNNSSTDIYYYYTCDSSMKDFEIYRAGYYKSNVGDSIYLEADQYVKKRSFQKIPLKGINAWERYVNSCINGEIHFYIYLDSVVNKYTDNAIKHERMYERHYVSTIKDLKKNDWTVTYP